MVVLETGLEGRLERVYVANNSHRGIAFGRVINYPNFNGFVQINNGGNYVGRACIARFSTVKNYLDRPPVANFVSSIASPDFQGLDGSQYILFGFWDKSWKTKNEFPILDEFNEHYSPGQVGRLFYIQSRGDFDRKLLIFKGGSDEISLSLGQLISIKMKYNGRNPRVVLGESEDHFFSLIKQAKKHKLTVVKMTDLQS